MRENGYDEIAEPYGLAAADCEQYQYPEDKIDLLPDHYRDTRNFSSDAYSAWLEMMNMRKQGQGRLTKEKEGILGFLLVNLLVTDGYILQLDFKDDPEKYLVRFVNERLEIDYNNEPIEDSESDAGFENADAEIELYDTKYVKKIQRKLKRKGFQFVWLYTFLQNFR